MLPQLLFMRHAEWVCSVVPWLALGKCPACFCSRDWKGLSPGQSRRRRKEAHPMPSVPSVSTSPGEAKGEGRRDKSWGQNDSGSLNTGVHLDLIGSNALFQTPSAYLKRSLGNRLLSYCESIILQIYSCLRSHYNRCQQRNLSCQGAASHEKE